MSVLFKPLDLLISVLGGLLAGAVFKRVWKAISGEEDKPEATSADHSMREVVLAAILEGAIVGGVKAAVQRVGARGIRRVTAPDRE